MKKYYSIAGMHCRSCELLVEQKIGQIPGVHTVRVNHQTGTAAITYQNDIPLDNQQVERAVRDAGYRIGSSGKRPWLSRNPIDWQEAVVAVAILFILFLTWHILGLETLGAKLTSTVGPGTALVVGLIAGASTCMALIGGLVIGMSARHAQRHPSATRWQKFSPNLAFNAGRIAGFGLLGGIIGLAGSAIRISGGFLGWLVIAAGLSMVILGVKLSGLFPRIQDVTLPAGIGRLLGLNRQRDNYSHIRAGVTGALTFFLPCGFTQTVQLYAISTGSFPAGALVMSAFALGTAPGLLGAGSISALAQGSVGRMVFRTAGIGILLLGLLNISGGWTLTGIILGGNATANAGTPIQNNRTAVAQLRAGKQYVDMTQSVYGYSLDRIIVKRGIPVVWNVTSTNSYTCASSLHVPTLDIATALKPGTNTIEFTPQRTGLMRFSCSMGMYGGIIDVID